MSTPTASDIIDEGSLHRYRTELPNTIIRGRKSRGLSVHSKWFYVYLKSVTGEQGECRRSTTEMVAESGLSRGQVSAAKKALAKHGVVVVIEGKNPRRDADRIRLKDLWPANFQEFSVQVVNTSDDTQLFDKYGNSISSVQVVNTGSGQCSGGEHKSSGGEHAYNEHACALASKLSDSGDGEVIQKLGSTGIYPPTPLPLAPLASPVVEEAAEGKEGKEEPSPKPSQVSFRLDETSLRTREQLDAEGFVSHDLGNGLAIPSPLGTQDGFCVRTPEVERISAEVKAERKSRRKMATWDADPMPGAPQPDATGEGNASTRKAARPKKHATLRTDFTPGFLAWWSTYPADRRLDKPLCFGVWVAHNLEERSGELIEKLERLKETTWKHTEAKFIKSSLPYLNSGRYEDDLVALSTIPTQAESGMSKVGYENAMAATRLVARMKAQDAEECGELPSLPRGTHEIG